MNGILEGLTASGFSFTSLGNDIAIGVPKKPIIIGFSGKARHGKTTAAKAILPMLQEVGYNVAIIPLAEELKLIAQRGFGVEPTAEKTPEIRRLYQEIGPVTKHLYGNEIFAKWVYEKGVKRNLDIILVDDVRLHDEVNYFDFLKKNNLIDNCILIRVNRPNFESDLTESAKKDISEVDLDNYQFKYIVDNDDTIEMLRDKIVKILMQEAIIKVS